MVRDAFTHVTHWVFDLDNTLWQGVLLEGEVKLRAEIATLFAELDKRGILLSIASKNNQQDAMEKLNQLGLADYLIYPVINWAQKSQNIKQLASKISISTDTLIFIDDNAFEREEVESAIPDIEVLPETALKDLLNHPRLQGSATAESVSRRKMYQQQIEREQAAVEFGREYLSFLRECEIVVRFGPVIPAYQDRVIELVQRTNQLNFSGKHYSRDQIEPLLVDSRVEKHVIHCRDKYGDYGLVGFALTTTDVKVLTVHDFMLSCRVQGKLIEKAFFSYLARRYLDNNGTLQVNFVPTKRNQLAQSVLREIGFDLPKSEQSERQLTTLHIEPELLDVDFLNYEIDSPKAQVIQFSPAGNSASATLRNSKR